MTRSGQRPYCPAHVPEHRAQGKGRVVRQTHVAVPAGLVEEEHGRDAFAGPVSHLYRTAPPTAWVDVDGPLRPLAFDLNRQRGAVMIVCRNPLTVNPQAEACVDAAYMTSWARGWG